ncbi:PAS domain-containing sensor histidine kinase [Paenibacillus hamazuiensis]|uniref:PAS domain-containing sensor histidine kinase n=1 Tax=Paenibacillus hamazuiensis TaxID=2936508 RepID=UPI00200C240B|nr:PAS domain-containing sensor histidine kinase [Paenibacillus hamazuiensis]
MKKTGRIAGVMFTSIVGVCFFLYYYFIIKSAWEGQLLGAVACSVVAWWLGGYYDKARYYASELESRTKELERSREELQNYFDSSNIMIWEYSISTKAFNMSSGAKETIGISSDVLLDPTEWADTDLFHKDDKEAVRSFVNDFLSGKPAKLQHRILPPDRDEVLWVESIANPIFRGGVFTKVIGSLTDITEEKAAEEMLRRSDKLHVIGELASGIAHEIRNPLTTIRGFMQLIKPKLEQQHYIDIVLEEIDRINQIVSELLVLAKPYAAHFRNKNIIDLIRDTVSFMQPQLILHSVQLDIQVQPGEGSPIVYCEENQLKQVFINIIKNAIEAMPGGGDISILIQRTGSYISIQVKDQGCGIENERLSQIGLPFHTTKESGTGLGLMVSNKILQNHNGSIAIASEVGKGTTIRILLPAVENVFNE